MADVVIHIDGSAIAAITAAFGALTVLVGSLTTMILTIRQGFTLKTVAAQTNGLNAAMTARAVLAESNVATPDEMAARTMPDSPPSAAPHH